MRTKSDRIDSLVSSSTMRVPVGPPAKPVAMTGWPSVFSVRATLTPLPPASVVWSTVRCRRPSRKFGTDSDLSIAALRVTVMIMRSRFPLPGHCADAAYGGAAAPLGATECDARDEEHDQRPADEPARPLHDGR